MREKPPRFAGGFTAKAVTLNKTHANLLLLIAGLFKKITSKTDNGKKTETYVWETKDAVKSIEVTFENEKVIGKKEKGLK